MHMALKICDNVILMGTDAIESMEQNLKVGNTMHISLETDGEIVENPIHDIFCGDYFGNFTDKFGVGWMVNFSNK